MIRILFQWLLWDKRESPFSLALETSFKGNISHIYHDDYDDNIVSDKGGFSVAGNGHLISCSSLLRSSSASVALSNYNGKALSQRRFKKVSNHLIHAFRLQTCFEKRPPNTLNTVNIERPTETHNITFYCVHHCFFSPPSSSKCFLYVVSYHFSANILVDTPFLCLVTIRWCVILTLIPQSLLNMVPLNFRIPRQELGMS